MPIMRNVTKQFIISCIIVFIIQRVTSVRFDYFLALVPLEVTKHLKIWQLITYIFLHGSLFHLFINLFIFWMFGRQVESAWGSRYFLRYCFVCGIGAGALYILTGPFSPIPCIGASGVIYGLLLAYAMLYPDSLIYVYFLFPVKAKHFVIFLGIITFLFSFSSPGSGIAHIAHLGGLVSGYIYLKYPLWRYRFLHKRYNPKTHTRTDTEWENEANRILDKILTQGVDKLTHKEKKIMEEYTKHKEKGNA